ncbi:MAG: hypothetical protein N2376_10915 [Clostridia bacterium]|nr:hypothetical protein [Clostridia bacterium]
MMKLNLDKNILALNGMPLNEKLSDILANALALATIGPPAKMMAWAVNLTNNGEFGIESNELKLIQAVVESSPYIVNLAKAQILEEIEKIKAQG